MNSQSVNNAVRVIPTVSSKSTRPKLKFPSKSRNASATRSI
jgi:hypothetical protein